MSQRTRTDFLALTISAGQGSTSVRSLGDDLTRYRYTITVQSDATGATRRFTFHDSHARWAASVDQLDRQALLEAFRCFVSDAQAGDQTFEDFCADFGYDVDSISARRTWDACRTSARKLRDLFHDPERFDPAYLLEQLAAAGIE